MSEDILELKDMYIRLYGVREKEFNVKTDTYKNVFYKNFKQVMIDGLNTDNSILTIIHKDSMHPIINEKPIHPTILIQYDIQENYFVRISGGNKKPFEIALPLKEAELDMTVEDDISRN